MVPTSPDLSRILWTELNITKSNLFLTHTSSAPRSITLCTGRVIPRPMTSGFPSPNSLMRRTWSPPSMPPTPPPRHPLPLPVLPVVVVAAVKRGGVISLVPQFSPSHFLPHHVQHFHSCIPLSTTPRHTSIRTSYIPGPPCANPP